MRGTNLTDIGWFRPDGLEMSDSDWHVHFAKAIGVFLNGHGLRTRDARGKSIVDDSFILFFNAHNEEVQFRLPKALQQHTWRDEVSTAWRDVGQRRDSFTGETLVPVVSNSVRLLRRRGRLTRATGPESKVLAPPRYATRR